MEGKIEEAVKTLNRGGIVIFPTDTAIGIGCRMDNEKAIKRLFNIRKRSFAKAVPVLVDSIDMAQKYLKPIDREIINKLINPFWPGALTIIMPCRVEKVPKLVRGGGENLGVRMPNHKMILDLIKKIGVPLLAPSANFQGEATPYNFKDLNPDLITLVDYVLEGKTSSAMNPSTVIDCSEKPWKVIRKGLIQISNLNFPHSLSSQKDRRIPDTKQEVILLIDTSSNKEISVGLKINGKMQLLKRKIGLNKAQTVLPLIEKILKQNSICLKQINGIQVNEGPGSFTGLRVGISIANALGFFLKIPINNKRVGKLAQPQYK